MDTVSSDSDTEEFDMLPRDLDMEDFKLLNMVPKGSEADRRWEPVREYEFKFGDENESIVSVDTVSDGSQSSEFDMME